MCVIHSSLANPYRQPIDLWSNDVEIEIQEDKSYLKLSDPLANYVIQLRKAAYNNGFSPNTPVIDLSGHVPGSVYILKGYTPNFPWIYSAYPGAEAFHKRAFSTITCEEIARAWLIVDDKPMFHPISPHLLLESGIDIHSDFSLVGTATFYSSFANQGSHISEHFLLKPIRHTNDAIAACHKTRSVQSLPDK
jgi:hypothetical protein